MTYEGVILILTCQKYINTRCINNKFKSPVINNWLFITTIGDLSLDSEYIFDNHNNILYIKCEDSYLHLLKKRILAIKYIYHLFELKQGILCCGDDVIFNEECLVKYLNSEKNNYEGQSGCDYGYIANDKNKLKNCTFDLWMYNYYCLHPEDFLNPMHNLQNINLDYLKSICKRPILHYAQGTIFYLSNYSCKILVSHMEKIKFNIFEYDEFTNSYPYTIEDCSIAFILYYNNINFTDFKYFYTNTDDTNYVCKSIT
jgi:hypothetical protein